MRAWLGWLLRGSLTAIQRERLAAWSALPEPDPEAPANATRFVVADVEATGLSIHLDRMIAIGAVAVEGSGVDFAHSFYAVLRQPQPSDDENILVHRISGSEQTGGMEPQEALLGFLEFAGKAPLVGYHAPFDDAMMARAMRRFLGLRFRRPWTDLAWLAPAVMPRVRDRDQSLDHWLRHFGIVVGQRHHALADALATAQLLLALLPNAGLQGLESAAALREAAAGLRWASRSPR